MKLAFVCLHDFVNPSLRCFNGTILDAGDGVIQSCDMLACMFHAGREFNDVIMIDDSADRRDDGCCAAQAAFSKALDFLEFDRSFIDLHMQIMLCDIDNRSSGDGRQDGVRLWYD